MKIQTPPTLRYIFKRVILCIHRDIPVALNEVEDSIDAVRSRYLLNVSVHVK